MHICTTCAGTRVVTLTMPNMLGPSNNRYQSSRQPYVKRNFVCYECNGRGHVECPVCSDRGEYPVVDAWGDYDSIEFCNCEAGRALMDAEREAVNAAECDAMYAHHAAHLNAPVEYGMTVAVDEVPF